LGVGRQAVEPDVGTVAAQLDLSLRRLVARLAPALRLAGHEYKTGRWQRLRRLQLRQYPLCKFCLERGTVTASRHINPKQAEPSPV